jgi:predicted nucleic acid-binding protein
MSWHASNGWPLITTDYVIDETLTLLRARGERTRADRLGHYFFNLSGVAIEFLAESDIRRAWEIFHQFGDKDWSFTDCTSKAVIDRLHVKRALTFDRHFAEFGSLRIEP